MDISKKGLEFIKRAEGFVPKIYNDQGHPAIGYGYRLTPQEAIKYKDGITEEEAEKLLLNKIKEKIRIIEKLIKVELSQNQQDAIISLVYNIGIGNFQNSSLLKYLNEKKFDLIPDEFRKWRRSGGKILPGLVARREEEIKLWLTSS
jgi:lysozyme